MSPRKSRYKTEYYQRKKYDLDGLRTFLRLSVEEMEQVARVFAEKLNMSRGPTIFLFPKRGWSAIDLPSSDMFEETEDKVFLKVFRANVSPQVVTREVDANLEDEAFAEAVVDACLGNLSPSAREAGDRNFSKRHRKPGVGSWDHPSHPKGGPHVRKKLDVAGSSIYIQ